MKTLRKTLLLLCSLAASFGLSAQTVSGKLIDENSQPLPYANVVLLSLPDSAFVSGTISGEDGSFTLETTSENQIVKISSIGYKTVCKPVSPADMGIVQLVSDAQMLGEVVVKAGLPQWNRTHKAAASKQVTIKRNPFEMSGSSLFCQMQETQRSAEY